MVKKSVASKWLTVEDPNEISQLVDDMLKDHTRLKDMIELEKNYGNILVKMFDKVKRPHNFYALVNLEEFSLEEFLQSLKDAKVNYSSKHYGRTYELASWDMVYLMVNETLPKEEFKKLVLSNITLLKADDLRSIGENNYCSKVILDRMVDVLSNNKRRLEYFVEGVFHNSFNGLPIDVLLTIPKECIGVKQLTIFLNNNSRTIEEYQKMLDYSVVKHLNISTIDVLRWAFGSSDASIRQQKLMEFVLKNKDVFNLGVSRTVNNLVTEDMMQTIPLTILEEQDLNIVIPLKEYLKYKNLE